MHSWDEDHKTDWENTSIIDVEPQLSTEKEGTRDNTRPDTAPHEQSRLRHGTEQRHRFHYS